MGIPAAGERPFRSADFRSHFGAGFERARAAALAQLPWRGRPRKPLELGMPLEPLELGSQESGMLLEPLGLGSPEQGMGS